MSRRVRALASEFVVVVLGVMVALAADSAVERWSQRASAERALEAVFDDLRNDIAQLDTFRLPYLENQGQSREDLSHWLESGDPIEDSVRFIHSIRLIGTYLTFDANTAAIESLRSAGRLDLLRDGGVRRALLRYLNTVEDVAEVDDLQRAAVLEIQGRVTPALVGQHAWSRVHDAWLAMDGPDRQAGEARAAAATGLDAESIRVSGALDELLVATEHMFRVQTTLYLRLRGDADTLDQALRSRRSAGD